MLTRTSFVLAILLLLGSVGCSGKVVTVDDLAGTWVMTKESKEMLPVARRGSGKLSLRSDGEFVAQELPAELVDVESTPTVSGTGTWQIRKVDGSAALLLTFNAFTSPGGQQTVPFRTLVFIDNDWGKPAPYFFLGDPDQGGRINFERAK